MQCWVVESLLNALGSHSYTCLLDLKVEMMNVPAGSRLQKACGGKQARYSGAGTEAEGLNMTAVTFTDRHVGLLICLFSFDRQHVNTDPSLLPLRVWLYLLRQAFGCAPAQPPAGPVCLALMAWGRALSHDFAQPQCPVVVMGSCSWTCPGPVEH